MEAAAYDRRMLIERGIANAREIEVSVLGNDDPQASVPGEVRPSGDFYTYEAKYLDERSELIIPAPLPEEIAERIRAAGRAGLSRPLTARAWPGSISCSIRARRKFYLGEINTIPGFTKISMYPKLWEASGLPYAQLVDRLIELALERKADRDRTERQFRRGK